MEEVNLNYSSLDKQLSDISQNNISNNNNNNNNIDNSSGLSNLESIKNYT